jgi:hypothetical protein
MKVYIVFEGEQNEDFCPIAVYKNEKSARAREKLEEETYKNDPLRVSNSKYWFYEGYDVIEE